MQVCLLENIWNSMIYKHITKGKVYIQLWLSKLRGEGGDILYTWQWWCYEGFTYWAMWDHVRLWCRDAPADLCKAITFSAYTPVMMMSIMTIMIMMMIMMTMMRMRITVPSLRHMPRVGFMRSHYILNFQCPDNSLIILVLLPTIMVIILVTLATITKTILVLQWQQWRYRQTLNSQIVHNYNNWDIWRCTEI